MPCRLSLILIKQPMQLFHDLISEILIESSSDPAETFRGSPPDGTILVLEEIQHVLNDKLELFKVDLVTLLHIFVFLFN